MHRIEEKRTKKLEKTVGCDKVRIQISLNVLVFQKKRTEFSLFDRNTKKWHNSLNNEIQVN